MSDPIVTVCIPTFNCAPYLGASLRSIVAQTYRHLEILVGDDASNDGTANVVRSLRDDRIVYVRHPRNLGQFANVNVLVGLARGECVAVYHADDLYEPEIVAREVAFLERFPEAGAVFAQDVLIDPEGHEYARLVLPLEVRGGRPLRFPVVLNALLTYKNRFLRTPSSMVRASVCQAVGPYRPEYGVAADLEMWLRIARRHPVGILEEYLFSYRHGHGSESQTARYLRTAPEEHFAIVDACLREGGLAVATPEALAAHEAHRGEESLMCAVNAYVLGRPDLVRTRLADVRLRRLLGSPQVERGRLLALYVALQVLRRVPRIGIVASLFHRRWHGTPPWARRIPRTLPRAERFVAP